MTTPTSDELWVDVISNAITSVLLRTGYFDIVNGGAAAAPAGNGITATMWLQGIAPVPLGSGLSSSSASLTYVVRMHKNMGTLPLDAIDPDLTRAASNIMRMLHSDYDFDGTIRNVDLLGAYGQTLQCSAGYLEQDNIMYRVYDITIPCIVNDVWPQTTTL